MMTPSLLFLIIRYSGNPKKKLYGFSFAVSLLGTVVYSEHLSKQLRLQPTFIMLIYKALMYFD